MSRARGGGTGLPANSPILQSVAKTTLAGNALTAGTPTLLSWAVPNDGNLHYFALACTLITTVATTGGAVICTFTTGGVAKTINVFTATKGVGVDYGGDTGAIGPTQVITCDPGTTVAVSQSTGLTGGAAALIGAIFGL